MRGFTSKTSIRELIAEVALRVQTVLAIDGSCLKRPKQAQCQLHVVPADDLAQRRLALYMQLLK
jgi:hypothetical protein